MTDYSYKATVETDEGTFTMEGDDPRVVSAQAAKMPVMMHKIQVQDRIQLDIPVDEYLGKIAELKKTDD